MKNPFRSWSRTEKQWMVFIVVWVLVTFFGIMIPALVLFK